MTTFDNFQRQLLTRRSIKEVAAGVTSYMDDGVDEITGGNP